MVGEKQGNKGLPSHCEGRREEVKRCHLRKQEKEKYILKKVQNLGWASREEGVRQEADLFDGTGGGMTST